MYKYVGVGVEGIVGVPATDLTDEEFAIYNAKVNAQHTTDQRGALLNSGLYEYVEDKKESVSKKHTDTESPTSTVVDAKDEDKDEDKDK